MNSENPPAVFIPRSYPVTITLSPSLKLEELDWDTSPTASIPGVCGKFLVTPGFPDAERASL